MKILFAICSVLVAAFSATVEAGGGSSGGSYKGGGHYGGSYHGGSYRGGAYGGVWFGAPIVIGAPFYYPYVYPRYYYPPAYYPPAYYPPAYYGYAPPVAQSYSGDVAPPAAVAPQSANWYYCRELDRYYPYAQQCPGGWQVVPAKPPAAQP